MSPRRKPPLEIPDVRLRLARIVPPLRSLLVLLEDLAEDLAVDVGAALPRDVTPPPIVKPNAPAAAKVTRISSMLSPVMQRAERELPPPPARAPTTTSGGLSKMERALLTAAAQYSARPLTSAQLASYAGYSRRNGDIPSALARLRREGFLDGTAITAAGRAKLGPTTPLPTGEALRAYWCARLDTVEGRFFDVICAAYPRGLTLGEACDAAGYSRANGDVPSALAKLRRLDLITQRQPLKANAHLFEEPSP